MDYGSLSGGPVFPEEKRAVNSPTAKPSEASGRGQPSVVFNETKPYKPGYNWSAVLRSGRWLRPGDFVRDKVQSRGVLILALVCALIFVTLLTISDTSFLFPRDFNAYGKPDKYLTTTHCVLSTDYNSSSAIANLISLVFNVVQSPDAALSADRCNYNWATMAVLNGNSTDGYVPIVPYPVFRVVDDLSRGVPHVPVIATVATALHSMDNWVNPLVFTANTTNGGYANFEGAYGFDTSESVLGTVLRMQFHCANTDCGHSTAYAAAFLNDALNPAIYWLDIVSAPDPDDLHSGDWMNITVQLWWLHMTPVPNAVVVLQWNDLSDNVRLSPMPQFAFTDDNGKASFAMRIVSVSNGSDLALAFRSVAGEKLWKYSVTSGVSELRVESPPADVYLAGTNITAVYTGVQYFYVQLIEEQARLPDVVVCVSPPRSGQLITAKGIALSVPAFKAGSLTNAVSIEGLQEYFNIVAPAIDSDLGLEIMTDHTGCARFPRFRFLDGSNGVYAIEFKADDLTVYSGQHYLVNYGVPDFSPMAFIGGGGPFVGLWTVLSFVFAFVLLCGNKHHGICAKVTIVVILLAWEIGIMVFVFGGNGMFVTGVLIPTVNYVKPCCDFKTQSITSVSLSFILFLMSTAMLVLFVILLVRSLKDVCRDSGHCGAKPRRKSVYNSLDGGDDDDATSVAGALHAQEEQQELAELTQNMGRLKRSDSVTSTGTFVPRSRRQQLKYRARAVLRAMKGFFKDIWFNLMHSAYCSRLSHDESRQLRYRLLVGRLLTKVRAVKKGSAEDKLRKYSLVHTWADRSETVVNVRAMLISWFDFVVAALALLYGLLMEPWWIQLVNKRGWRRYKALGWLWSTMDSDVAAAGPYSREGSDRERWQVLQEPLDANDAIPIISADESMPQYSRYHGTSRESQGQLYVLRARRRTVILIQTAVAAVLKTVRCVVVLVKQVVVWVKSRQQANNAYAAFETWNDFYYSQRILTALLSSLFLCGLVAVFVSVIFSWMVSYMYAALSAFEDANDQVDLRLLWPPGNSRYTEISHVIFIVFGFLVSQLKEVIGKGSFDMVFQQVVPPATGGLAFITWCGVAFAWGLMLKAYRREVLDGRRGKWKFDPNSTNAFNASKYIGYQAVHCVVGYFGIFLFSFILALMIVLLIFVKPLFPMVKSIVIGSLFNINGTLFKLVLPLLIQQLLKLILVNGRNEIRNIIIFTLADFAFMVVNFVIGALVVIKRSLLIIGGLLLTFWRLDLDWISIDSGHAAWCAMIVIDCRENNPVVITFCDLIFRDINTRRKMIGKQPHIDEDYVSCPIPCCCCIPLVPALKLCYPKPGATMCKASNRDIFSDAEYARDAVGTRDKRRASVLSASARPAQPKHRGESWARDPLLPAGEVESAHCEMRPLSDQPIRTHSGSESFVDGLGSVRHDLRCRHMRRQQIINRWWLYVVLSKNPILLRYRKQAASTELLPRIFSARAIVHGFLELSVAVFGDRCIRYKRCFVALRFGFLVFYPSTHARVPSGTIDLADVLHIDGVTEDPLCLDLVMTQKTFRVRFASAEDMKSWESCIRQVWERPRASTESVTSRSTSPGPEDPVVIDSAGVDVEALPM